MKKIYLDNCCIQRPCDEKNQARIILESEIVLFLLSLIVKGEISLLSSDALIYEILKNSNSIRRNYGFNLLSKAEINIKIDADVNQKATEIMKCGIDPLDALHVALAEKGKADYFVSCDDELIKKAQKCNKISIITLNLIDIFKELEK